MEGRAMGQVLHGSATTIEAIRRAIQARQESVRAAAKRYGVSPTTVQKWRGRETSVDARMGPKEARSTVLSPEEEAIVVAFRRHTLRSCPSMRWKFGVELERPSVRRPEVELL